MLTRFSLKPLRALSAGVFAASLFGLVFLYHAPSHDFFPQHIPSIPTRPAGSASDTGGPLAPLPLLAEYGGPGPDGGDDGDGSPDRLTSKFCNDRFGTKYLTDLRSTAFQYCNASSLSSLSCFHSHTGSDEQRDSFCAVRGSVLDLDAQKFVLDCGIQLPGANDTARGVVPFSAVRQYWYDTGPRYIMDNFFDFFTPAQAGRSAPPRVASPSSPTSSRRFALLVKREGAENLWHCLLEIWSMAMTMDVLRMTRDPADADGGPFFRVPDDVDRLQVVILDGRADGPYYDLWTLFSGRAPIRLAQIGDNPEARRFFLGNTTDVEADAGADLRLIVPLAGASNPTWQNDWVARDCTQSPILQAFVGRVLAHYGVGLAPAPAPAADEDAPVPPVRVTFVDRRDADTRKLQDQDGLLAAVQARYPDVQVDAVDFGALAFAQQLRVARRTDVLVGVHGAGLTHTMFLREHTTAVVEIQPSDMDDVFMGFRNLANMRGVTYFRTHANPVNKTVDATEAATTAETIGTAAHRRTRRAAWHTENFAVDQDVFVHTVGAAIQAVYNKGSRTHEVVY